MQALKIIDLWINQSSKNFPMILMQTLKSIAVNN